MRLALADGAELFYKIDDFTDPWTEPETIVLHHGMAKNHKMWFGWMPVLARHYRVVRLDMRGMGQSSVPEPGYPWSLDNFADDLLGLLDGLGLDKVHLIGETVGGSIAMRFATLHQERLLSLCVCTSPTSFLDPHHVERSALIHRAGVAAWMARVVWTESGDDGPATIIPVADGRLEVAANGEMRVDRKAEGGTYPEMKRVREIKQEIKRRLESKISA